MKPQKEWLVQTIVSLAYILVSLSAVFVNKAVSYSFLFRSTSILLIFQMATSCLVFRIARDKLRWIDFPELSWDLLKRVFPISFLYCANAVVALNALRDLSIPSYGVVKRLAPLATVTVEYIVLGKVYSLQTYGTLIMMIFGTILASKNDLNSVADGWMYGLLSCLLQACCLVLVKKSGVEGDLGIFGLCYYHSLFSFVLLTLLVLLSGEYQYAHQHDALTNWTFFVLVLVSSVVGIVLNFVQFLCSQRTTPTNTMVCGHIKSLFQTFFGLFTFGGATWNLSYITGILMSTLGGLLYAWTRYQFFKQLEKTYNENM